MASREDLRSALARTPNRLPAPRGRAAVAAVLSEDLELLLVRRTHREGDPWSGNLAFPGGRVEVGEDPFEAALRETREEVGLHLDPAWQVGALDELPVVGGKPGLVVHPFVFHLPGGWPVFSLQPDEIAGTVRIPLDYLRARTGRGTHEWTRGGQSMTLPKVDLPDTDVPLWGLTLHMVDELLSRLDGTW